MEDILDIYEMPRNLTVHLYAWMRNPTGYLWSSSALTNSFGDTAKIDSEYMSYGTCSIFAFSTPFEGISHVSVLEHHTEKAWAEQISIYLISIIEKTKPVLRYRPITSMEV